VRATAKGERAPGVESGLDELPQGVRGVVMAVDVEGGLRKRLVEMGVTPGVLIAVERVAPLGDPSPWKSAATVFPCARRKPRRSA
jgi:Fe2+ transport system protein FeoA